jgi:precorrin-2 dehydrogenase/sirohydrochlorin ferrochelatase
MLYPVFMKLESVPCMVIGGGAVASRKVKGLLAASADVTVISPEVSDQLSGLADSGKIVWRSRTFQPGDLEGCRLVIAATDSTRINQMVYEEASVRGIPVNSVDDPEHSSFFVPALARRGELTIAISTSGIAPYLARRLRQYLESKLYPGLEEDLEAVRLARARISGMSVSFEEKKELVERELEPLVQKILLGMEGS